MLSFMCWIWTSSTKLLLLAQEVGANNNNFTGPFPDQFCSPDCFKFIQKIDFSYGTLSGLLPSCISKMPWLEEFKLQNNHVSQVLKGFMSIKIGTALAQVD